jgi:hypothetical protein
MNENTTLRKLTFRDVQNIADQVIFQASIIVVQRDPKDKKMDVRSAFLHKLWIRIARKIDVQAGGYLNFKEDETHERVLMKNLKTILDTHLDEPISKEGYDQFLDQFMKKAFKNLEQ